MFFWDRCAASEDLLRLGQIHVTVMCFRYIKSKSLKMQFGSVLKQEDGTVFIVCLLFQSMFVSALLGERDSLHTDWIQDFRPLKRF